MNHHMTYAYIIRRGEAFAIQKTETSDKYGSEHEVGWEEGLTLDEALAVVGDAELIRCDD